VLYTDFAKAFDVMSIPKLLHKLSNFGIVGQLLSIIKSFLTNRSQSVKIGSCFSSVLPLVSGVPQGSVLGPILFLIFINDVTESFDVYCFKSKLFADNLKSYNVVDYRSDPICVQSALDSLKACSDFWQFRLSVPKCSSLFLAGQNNYVYVHQLHIANNAINTFYVVTDLGVMIDCRLMFSA